jgi:glycosyltransferase involved in cell wall biosynthesis
VSIPHVDAQRADVRLAAGSYTAQSGSAEARPQVRGKFLFTGSRKLYLRGATYGTFAPGLDGYPYPDPHVVSADFAAMAAAGLNSVRTYTVPPTWLLDLARQHGLHVMVGLPWEQHVAFLSDFDRVRSIQERVRAGVRACVRHPAVLCYAVGNEIPASIVRWHGARAIERFIRRLAEIAHEEHPSSLVTYVNYPSTEYLRLPFLDFVSFNVYLEEPDRLQAYLSRLQNLADDKPLVVAEIGLDSRRNGEAVQAAGLDWQLRTAFGVGCAGAFVFAWTDEWHRGGREVDDWDFGLTTRDRRPKRALAAVGQAFAEVPFAANRPWPRISVVVCSFNGARTIRECLDGLLRLEYADYEVITVDDGSTDATSAIMREYPFRHFSRDHLGLSAARNAGLAAASGEIVAYIDDDAVPDVHWLQFLAATYLDTDHAAVGGPNIPPPAETPIADCVANAPGGPMHVLVSDIQAEHLPGCNLSARTACLKKIGGFDTDFRVAGDDVDVCWRLQQQNWTLGFSHGAVVWHRRRDTLAGYWKQQRGYGKAEALLERKWPEKYTSAGNLIWADRLYGKGLPEMLPFIRHRIYYGVWGSGLFQRMYSPWHNRLVWLPQMPEWYLLIALLSVLAALGELWKSLLLALPLLAVCVSAVLVQAALGGARASFSRPPRSRLNRLQLRATVAFLHLLQPLARLTGRIRHGLTPWRRPHATDCLLPRRHSATIWTERWRAPEDWLRAIEAALRARRAPPRRGSAFDRWDLEVATGGLGGARLQLAVEEHGSGRQLWRYRIEPTYTARSVVAVCASTGLAIGAGFDHIWLVASGFGLAACLMVVLLLQSSAGAAWALRHGLREAAAQFERCSKTPTHEGHPSRLTQAAGVASPDSTPGAEP